jgi:hypothetical protein
MAATELPSCMDRSQDRHEVGFVLGLEADDEAEEDVVNEQWAVRDDCWYQIRSHERKARRQGHD